MKLTRISPKKIREIALSESPPVFTETIRATAQAQLESCEKEANGRHQEKVRGIFEKLQHLRNIGDMSIPDYLWQALKQECGVK